MRISEEAHISQLVDSMAEKALWHVRSRSLKTVVRLLPPSRVFLATLSGLSLLVANLPPDAATDVVVTNRDKH